MTLTACLIALLLVAPARIGAQTFDRSQIEREVMAVLDAFFDAINRLDAQAEERTYHFPHFRLPGGGMSVLDKSGDAGLDEHALHDPAAIRMGPFGWTRRRIFHMSNSKVHVDTEVTRYRKEIASA